MRCLYCESLSVKVVDTVPTDNKVLRRRKCLECNNVFFTEEIAHTADSDSGRIIWGKLNHIRYERSRE